MADPEDFGSWINSTQDQFTTDLPALPSEIESAISGINTVVSTLSGLLDTALLLLDAVSAFVGGNVDLLLSAIEAVIAEIESIIDDLRNTGLYLTGDWYLAEFPFDRLQGGFANYEVRTLGRFLDRNDPTRPDIPEGQPVLGVFLYHATDVSSLTSLVRFLTQLVDFFSFDLSFTKTLQTPSNLQVKYGTPSTNFRVNVSLAETFGANPDVLDVAHVQWELSAPTVSLPLVAAPLPPPDGFLVTVSTVRDGLSVFFDRPRPNSIQVPGPGGDKVQDREVGRVLDPHGVPLQLHGGVDMLEVDSSIDYNNAMAGAGEVKPGAARVWVQKSPSDPTPIPVSALQTDSGFPLLQRTYFVPTPTVSEDLLADGFLQRSRFHINLNVTEMPLDANFVESGGEVSADPSTFKRADTYYVRAVAVSENVLSDTDFKYTLDGDTIYVPGKPFRAKYGRANGTPLSKADKGEFSSAAAVNFPNPETRTYIDLVTAALAVLVLSRSDLQIGRAASFEAGKAAQATGLESFSSLIPRILNTPNPDDFFNLSDEDGEYSDSWGFRASVLRGCRLMAAEMYRTSGSNPALEAQLIASASVLLDFTWDQSDLFLTSTGNQGPVEYPESILTSLDNGSIPEGLVRNPECAGLGINRGTLSGSSVGLDVSVDVREPYFYQRTEAGYTVGSVDRSPCLNVRFNDGSYRLFYLRNVIPEEVYEAARSVLGVASPSILRDANDGAWLSVRLGQMLPSLDGLLDTVLEWARSFAKGIANATDALQAYIEFLEARILELQGLLNRISGLTSDIIPIQLPQFSILFLLGSGTQDIISQFSQADNSPVDGAVTYGGGATVLAVAPPDFVIDLFVGLLSE